MLAATNPDRKDEEEQKVEDPFEMGQEEDKKRNFSIKYRPH